VAEPTASFGKLATTSKRFARRLLAAGENRPELLRVEVQEESERLQQACLCVVGTSVWRKVDLGLKDDMPAMVRLVG
jgi:uncharacterized membrane protein YqjE